MPTGKQNTFANGTLPDAVVVQFRDRRPVNLVGAFESPVVPADGEAISTASAKELAARSAHIEASYGTTPEASHVVAGNAEVAAALAGMGESATLDELAIQVRERATANLRVEA